MLLVLTRLGHDIIDDQLVFLRGHGRDHVSHAVHSVVDDGVGPDGCGRLVLVVLGLENQAIHVAGRWCISMVCIMGRGDHMQEAVRLRIVPEGGD